MPLPELLHFRVSHYNEKVRWTLDLKKVAHTRRALVPGFHIPRARWVSGQNKLPVLLLDGRVLHDSSTIIAELERLHPEPALYPEDEDERARALEIEEYFDEEVAPDLRRLFWSTYLDDSEACTRMATAGAGGTTQTIWRALFPAMRPAFRGNMGVRPEALERARERLPKHVDRLEAEIGPSGFLVGDRFTIADLTAAAVMTAILRPPQFPYPLPDPWPQPLVDLRASIAERPGCKWVLEIYERHRGASAEATS